MFNNITLSDAVYDDDDPDGYPAEVEDDEYEEVEPSLPRYNPDPQEEGGLVLSSLTLPTGWRWHNSPDTSAGYVVIDERYVVWDGPAQSGRATYSERLEGLKEWVVANNLKARISRYRDAHLWEDPVAQTGWELSTRQPIQFLVCTTRYWNYNYGDADWVANQDARVECRECNTQHSIGATRCPATNMPNFCPRCSRERANVQWHEILRVWWCSSCAYSCSECGQPTPPDFDYCTDCREIHVCRTCGEREWLFPGETSSHVDSLCVPCRDHQCGQCDAIDRRHALQWSPAQERWLCRSCWRTALDDLNEDTSEEGDDDVQTILSIPGRENIRMCGIELEGANGLGGDGRTLARELYRAGLSQYDSVQGYHHGGGSFMHVELDSSVDWEVVMGPLNPADNDHMIAVNRAMRMIRNGIHAGTLKLDLRCGLHIHVGAEGFGLGQAYNLNTLFSYVEDVMFRLAAAKWPIHRSMTGSPYCQPVEKSTSKLAFGREVGQNESRDARRVALNFRNYFQRMLNNCQCGAVRFDSWENCTCDLGKCTFEFRLFNSTANPRKLHAYMALAQALVAKAGALPEIENPHDDFPPHTFLAKPFKGMTETEQEQSVEAWVPRIRWLLHELPLTDDERASVLYCVRNSDLAMLGESVIDELATVTTTEEVTA
jgi:hypothetical protein